MIKGITVKLINLVDSGQSDPFGNPIMQETSINVENVLIQPVQVMILLTQLTYGKKQSIILRFQRRRSYLGKSDCQFFGRDLKCLASLDGHVPYR